MELYAFWVSGAVAIIATVFVIVNPNPVHGLLNLVLSLLAVASVFFTLGAPFAGVLEVIVYAGAIMVLFVFVVMMLNLGDTTVRQEQAWLKPGTWILPGVLSSLLLYEVLILMLGRETTPAGLVEIGPKAVGQALYGPYLLAVELASMMLTAGLVAAYHLGKHE